MINGDQSLHNLKCAACNSPALKHLYNMSDYNIYKCISCGTGTVIPIPGDEILDSFYQGFIPELKHEQIINKAPIAKTFFENIGLSKFPGKSFLDLGGGNGLFSYVFEQLLHASSTYIDRDPKACGFVRDELKVSNVIQGDVSNISELVKSKRYDLIYSRHMIEHLPDPFSLIKISLQLLKPDGMAIFQCPNGASLEYLAYTDSNLWQRFNNICKSTPCSKIWLFWHFISGDILHGIDPPRHLWALTKKGIVAWAKRYGYHVDIFTTHLGDLPFSPGYLRKKGSRSIVENIVGQKFLAPIQGGTHLIAKFKKPNDNY